jgi:hypothetical protein
MGIFRKRRNYEPQLIAKALDPYHYPVDDDGNPVPTPSTRAASNERGPQEADVERMSDPPQGHPATDVAAATDTDEHIVVDLTAENPSDMPKPTDDSLAAHFARILPPPQDPSDQPMDGPPKGTAQAS